MNEFLHQLIERCGLIAIFLGCVAEGESAAIFGGFLAHQAVFAPWKVFAAAFLGAFTGDTLFFLLGRRFSEHPIVRRMRRKPGFSRAYRLLREHPNLFVLSNRYVYGLRQVGGIAAGLSNIPLPRFLALNALASIIWAALFSTIGYVFGLGAEQLISKEILAHRHLLVGLAIVAVVALAAWLLSHYVARREKRAEAREKSE